MEPSLISEGNLPTMEVMDAAILASMEPSLISEAWYRNLTVTPSTLINSTRVSSATSC